VSNLSTELAAIGIPEPSQKAVLETEGAAEIVTSAVLGYLRHDAADPLLGHELLTTLRSMTERLEFELARSGCSVTTPAKPRTIAVKRKAHRWVNSKDGDPVAVPHEYESHEKCPHDLIEVDEAASEVTCRRCGLLVNAVWWLARHTDQITKAEKWRHSLATDRKRLEGEIAELKADLSRTKQANKRAKQTSAKQALRADGADYLIPPSPKRKPPRKS
jgi:hypothetical protein